MSSIDGATGAHLTTEEKWTARTGRRRRQRRAFLLVLPLLVFLAFAFLAPIASMLYRSAYNPTVANLIPETLTALAGWKDTGDVPDRAVMTAMAADLQRLALSRESGRLAAEINRAYPGASSTINSAARKLRRLDEAEIAENGATILTEANPRWSDPDFWRAIRRVGAVYTLDNYLTALDLERNAHGDIQQRQSARIYVQLYMKTLGMALTITVLCVLLGYPVAYYLANSPPRRANLLMVLVLLPFWTSLLVRTTAWIALLQTNGVLNSTLIKKKRENK